MRKGIIFLGFFLLIFSCKKEEQLNISSKLLSNLMFISYYQNAKQMNDTLLLKTIIKLDDEVYNYIKKYNYLIIDEETNNIDGNRYYLVIYNKSIKELQKRMYKDNELESILMNVNKIPIINDASIKKDLFYDYKRNCYAVKGRQIDTLNYFDYLYKIKEEIISNIKRDKQGLPRFDLEYYVDKDTVLLLNSDFFYGYSQEEAKKVKEFSMKLIEKEKLKMLKNFDFIVFKVKDGWIIPYEEQRYYKEKYYKGN